jgi:hypothetical protein
MEDYRSIHRTKYLERVEAAEKIEHLNKLVENIKTHTNIRQIQKTVQEMADTIHNKLDITKLSQIGLNLVEAISSNPNTKVDFNIHVQVQMSQDVQKNVKSILSLCGIDDNIEVQYEMDCSRDEEIARQLAQEAPPPIARRPRGRPRRATLAQ